MGYRSARLLVLLVVVCCALAAPAQAADPVVAAAGDIACDPSGTYFNGGLGDATHCRQKYTSDMLMTESLAAVLAVGDTQYEEGSLAQFQGSYDLSWGRLKSLTRPALGNHEYFVGSGDPTGSGYFDYFNGVGSPTGPAGDRGKGYYSFDVGDWHLISLNSVCQEVGGCAAGSAQEEWLRADLEAHPNSCTLAYWHHPFYNSGGEGSYTGTRDLWQALHEAGAELVINGHAHQYERFAPQDLQGNVDTNYGIREIIVGTGGKSLGGFGVVHPNSQARDNQNFGFLKLILHAGSYDWSFRRESGTSGDSGSTTCHGAPPGGPPHAETGPATSVGDTSARLNAAVNPKGHAETTYHFEYGSTASYDSATAPQAVSPVNSAHRQVGAELSGLAPGAAYYYRVVATSNAGTSPGEDRTFTLGTPAGRYAGTIAATAGLRSHWRLGETGGTFGFDQKGLELGTYAGGPSLGQAGALAGDPDKGVGFDGVDDEMSTTGPVVSTSGTLEGWFLWRQGKALLRDDSWGSGWILAYENTSGNLGYRVGGRAFSTGKDVNDLARDGSWHHIAVTKNGSDGAIYLDGRLEHPDVGATNDPAAGPWHVMRNGQHTEFAQGEADEVAIYDVALSAATIKEHYNAGQPDTTPPDTSITAGPSGLTQDANASFSFSSTESLSTFKCKLDGPGAAVGTEVSCSSPKSYSALADGSYTFRVYAIDFAENADPTPASRSFTVDTTAPQTTIDSGPSGTTASTNPQFTFSASESGSSFQCRLDDSGNWSACTSPKSYTALPSGAHTFEVRASDPAGNTDATPASRSFTVTADTTPPDTTITSGPSGTTSKTSASFSFTSSESNSTFQCRLDNTSWTTCTSPKSYAKLPSGTRTFEVRAIDAAGNVDASPASRSWTIKRGAGSATAFSTTLATPDYRTSG